MLLPSRARGGPWVCGVECSKVPTVYYNKVCTLLGLLLLPSVVLSTLLSPDILDRLISLCFLQSSQLPYPHFTDEETETHICSMGFFLNALLPREGPLSSICHHSLYLPKLKATHCQVSCVQNLMSTRVPCRVDQNMSLFLQ